MGYAVVACREIGSSRYHAFRRTAGSGESTVGTSLVENTDSLDSDGIALVESADSVEPGGIASADAADAAGHGESAKAVTAVDPDVIDDLGDEIATLAAHIHAATHRVLVLIGEFDRLRGWEGSGHANCANWLSTRTGFDLGTAREHVRAARALRTLPLTSAAMARGALSFSKVRALSRVACADNEADLLELAQGTTTAQLERMVRAWKKGNRRDEEQWERERYGSRTFSVFSDDDGMYVIRGRVTPEVGALLMRAVEAASDALYRDATVHATARESDLASAQRRADAIALLAERALAAGFGRVDRSAETKGVTAFDTCDAGAMMTERGSDSASCEHGVTTDVPISGTRAQRYQVILHVDAATLSADGDPGRSELEDGTRVSAETSRRLSCDASIVRITHDSDGAILDAGRKTRTISPALRRALEVRDRGCRFPGCHLRFTDAHHVTHWADGGGTSLENCVLLCPHHHRLVHEGGWRVVWWGSTSPAFLDPRGGTHVDGRWQPPELPDQPVAVLVRDNERHGGTPDGWTASARWRREADIPNDAYFRASEAL